jgi:anaerobic magnesium-protoporphyrin IX monomethyl ester cyclase
MRVLLINPFYPISETPSPPLGLAYLAAALEEAGVEVRVLDLVVHPYRPQMLADLLDEFQPEIAGSTAVTMTVGHAMSVLTEIKRLRPQIVTVMGGPHVSFSARETLQACPALDIAVIGEGERTIVELAPAAAGISKVSTESPPVSETPFASRRAGSSSPTWTACRRRHGICCPWAAIAPWACRSA